MSPAMAGGSSSSLTIRFSDSSWHLGLPVCHLFPASLWFNGTLGSKAAIDFLYFPCPSCPYSHHPHEKTCTTKPNVVVQSTLLTPRPIRFTRALPPRGSRDPLRLAEGGALPYQGARHCPGFSLPPHLLPSNRWVRRCSVPRSSSSRSPSTTPPLSTLFITQSKVTAQ